MTMAKIVAANRTTPGRTLYHGGDSWRFTAQRTGGTTGLDAAQPYLWTVLQHHNDHIHPVVADYAAAALDFDIGAESHALDPTIWYEVILTMRAATGQRLEFVKALRPEVAQLLLAYSPGAGNRLITVNQRPQPLGEPLDVIVGQTYRLVAPALLLYGETVGEFDHWSVTSGSPSAALTLPDREIVITAAANSQTYTAHYRDLRRADRVLLPLVPSVTEEKR